MTSKVSPKIDGSMILFINDMSLLAAGDHKYMCILKLKQDIPSQDRGQKC